MKKDVMLIWFQEKQLNSLWCRQVAPEPYCNVLAKKQTKCNALGTQMVVTERKALITSWLQKNEKHWQAIKGREQKDETESKKNKPSKKNLDDTRNTSGDAGETCGPENMTWKRSQTERVRERSEDKSRF